MVNGYAKPALRSLDLYAYSSTVARTLVNGFQCTPNSGYSFAWVVSVNGNSVPLGLESKVRKSRCEKHG